MSRRFWDRAIVLLHPWAVALLCPSGALSGCADGERSPPTLVAEGGATDEGASGDAGSPTGGSEPHAGAGGASLVGGQPGGGAAGDSRGEGGAGRGGDAHQGCAESPAATAFCDDGNSCTVDACAPGGGCTHAPLEDGASCDDRDACTAADRCEAGICVGTAGLGRASVLGSVSTFGAFAEGGPAHQGLSAILSERYLVFAEPLQPGLALRLVEREGDTLRLRSELTTLAPLKYDSFGLIGDMLLGTHLVPLSATRVALVSSHYAVEVFDVVDGELVSRDREWLDHAGWELSGVGAGSYLYTCGDGLEVYDVASDGQVRLSRRIADIWPCRSLALSPDGKELYQATTRDVRVFDLSDPAQPVRRDVVIRPQRYYVGVAAGAGGRLALQEDVVFETSGPASVLRTLDFSEEVVFPSIYHDAVVYGAGFAGADLALQYERVAGEEVALSLETFALGASPPPRRSAYTFAKFADAGSERVQVYSLATAGALAVVAPTRQVLDVTGDVITELRGTAQGSLSRVRPAGPGRVAAYGSSSTHLVDITDAAHPVLLFGGLLEPGEGGPMSYELGTSAPMWLGFEADNAVIPKAPKEAKVVQLEPLSGAAPRQVGFVRIEGGYALRATSAGLLFELRAATSGSGHLLRAYALPHRAGEGQALAPFAEGALDSSGMSTPRFAVDVAQPDDRLVLAGRNASDASQILVRWFEHQDDAWKPVASLALPTLLASQNTADFVAISGDRALVGSEAGRRLHVVERSPEGLSVLATRDFTPDPTAVPYEEWSLGAPLGLDGGRVYLPAVYRDAELVVRARVLVLDLATLQEVAEYELPEPALSMATSDGKLVFGMASHISVASPECAP